MKLFNSEEKCTVAVKSAVKWIAVPSMVIAIALTSACSKHENHDGHNHDAAHHEHSEMDKEAKHDDGDHKHGHEQSMHGKIEIKHAWARKPAPGQDLSAAYLTVTNHSNEPVEIKSVSANRVDKVEIHETLNNDDKMKMVELKALVIPAQQTIELKPAGKHLMLMGLQDGFADLEQLTLSIELSNGETLTQALPLQIDGEKEQGGDHHQH